MYNLNKSSTLTTASCSFSNCRCRSAAVNGLGCRSGPGPVPTPVLSPGCAAVEITPPKPGDTICGPVLFTAFWFEGSTFNAGDESGRGGGAICCDALLDLEVGTEVVIRGEEANG
jgi:hypothetical protein